MAVADNLVKESCPWIRLSLVLHMHKGLKLNRIVPETKGEFLKIARKKASFFQSLLHGVEQLSKELAESLECAFKNRCVL